MINLSAFIAYHARVAPDRPALMFDNTSVSYAQFADRIARTGGWLVGMGIAPGDVVAVLMKNSLAFMDLAFAVSHIGAVFLPINFRLSADEVAYIVGDAGAKLLVVDEELSAAAARAPAKIVVADRAAQADATRLGAGSSVEMRALQKSDLYRLMYTSGTTDRPKGVMHTYDNFYWKSAGLGVALGIGADTRLLTTGPLYHVGAFDLPGIGVLWAGGMMYLHREFDAAACLESIARHRLNAAWLAPVMTSALLACPGREKYDVSSLRWAIGGGERTPEQRIRDFSGYFTNARYIDAYGLTESCSGDTLMEPDREIEKIGSVGRAIPHVEVRIRSRDGAFAEANEEGEICLRGPKVAEGYWNAPEKTKASFSGEWFLTGDVGYLDADGFLFLTDRKKDMIISGGENIASSEVERVIYQMPEVAEVAVIGAPDEKWGETPVAIVVLAPGAELDHEKLVAHCEGKLARFKIPKRTILRETLPRNPSGKILKRLLREDIAGS